MKQRTWLLLALFVALGAGAYFAIQYKKKNRAGSAVSWDMDFAVPETDKIFKIFLADRNNHTVTLERQGDHWTYNKVFTARQTAVDNLMEIISKVRVMYIPPEAAEANMIKSLASEGIKVEIYDQAGKALKKYYVGGVTADESGTFMIMEGAERPYVTHIPTMQGGLRVGLLMEHEDDWKDRTVFAEKPENIQSVSVEYPQMKSESFKIEKTGSAQFEVSPFFSTTPVSQLPQRKGSAEGYLLAFEKLIAEGYETENELRDSVSHLVPFAIVTLRKTNGEEKQVKFWPIEESLPQINGQVQTIRYFSECNWGPFLLTQQHVFGPVFRNYRYFFNGNTTAPQTRN